MSNKRYKFTVERDTNLMIPRYHYQIFCSEDYGKNWFPIVIQDTVMKLSRKRAIEKAREEVREMQVVDDSSEVIYEEEVH